MSAVMVGTRVVAGAPCKATVAPAPNDQYGRIPSFAFARWARHHRAQRFQEVDEFVLTHIVRPAFVFVQLIDERAVTLDTGCDDDVDLVSRGG